jgi:hypothetical protein
MVEKGSICSKNALSAQVLSANWGGWRVISMFSGHLWMVNIWF